MINIEQMYSFFLEKKNDANVNNRYKGNESWYHASSAGMCTRKIYFESVEQVPTTNPPEDKGQRIMRLGTLVHEDFQDALLSSFEYYKAKKEKESSKEKEKDRNCLDNNLNNNILSEEKEKKKIYKRKKEKESLEMLFGEIDEIIVEQEITIPDLNVRGFYDIVFKMKNGQILLFDIKTIAGYSYKLKFGRKKDTNPSHHQEMQLGTYGYALREQYGRLDGLYLFYYNKDTSLLKTLPVGSQYIDRAKGFWEMIKSTHKFGLPSMEEGVAPVMKWECGYCRFKDYCQGR